VTKTVKPKKIHARYGLTKLPDATITPLLDGSLKGLTENATIFSKPPVDLKTYGASISAYHDALPAAILDGGKNAVALKNKLRDVVLKMYAENAHYVEANCNDDMQTFLLSGFQPASTTNSPPQPLDQPAIASVVQGPLPGQLKVKIRSVKKAASYELRFAPVPNGGGTPTWTQQAVASTKPLILTGLTPGTTYTLQVRALGLLGYTNWSDAVTRMVT
jgi:hypothetical protein